MDDQQAEDWNTADIEAQPDSARQPDESSQGRPKRKRAADKNTSYNESSTDGEGGSDGDFGAKGAKKGAAKTKPGREAKSRAAPVAKTKAKAPRAKAQPKEKPETTTKPDGKPTEGHSEPVERPRRVAASRSAAATAVTAAGDAIVDGRPRPAGAYGSILDDRDGDAGGDDDVYKRLFAPVTDEEIQRWQGWCEIESEPDFFNFILHELGVRNASVQEVYGIDEDTLGSLSNPLGLIFLYKYVEEDEGDVGDGCPDALWFANQTTDNACGTVAMLNICMNQEQSVQLGQHLSDFREKTRHLHPALRGHMLSSDAYIRAKHNSFARRLDMLTADAHLRESWEEENSKYKKRGRKSKYSDDEAAFHFIAYVPQGDDVWELNGMQEWPLKLPGDSPEGTSAHEGRAAAKHWTSRASERIAARVQGYAEEAGFVLLALCGTDTGTASESPSKEAGTAELRVAAARKGDYTPAVYCWLKKLADKGLLRGLATGEHE